MTARYQLIAAGGVFDHQTRSNIPPSRSSSAWIEYQEWLTAGGVPLPADEGGQLPIADAIARRVEDINAWSAGLRNKAVAGRSSGEMASWSIKLAEGRAWLASGNVADAPTLVAIATIRGITLADLVARVMAQAEPFLQAEAAIDGIRGKHCDAIEAMADVRDVIAYDWTAGWPVIP